MNKEYETKPDIFKKTWHFYAVPAILNKMSTVD
jgi:hypothetical protein